MQSTKCVHEAYEYQRSRSFIDFDPNLSDSIFLNFFSWITTRPIEAKFHVEPPWDGERKLVQMVQVTWPRWPSCRYMVKPVKIFFSGTERLMTLKLGMQHWVREYNQVCPNDAPVLTLTYFTAMSNLVPYAFVWEKVKTMNFSKLL